MCRFRSLRQIAAALLALCVLIVPSLAQTPAPVSGLVTDPAGQPLTGATVSSGTGSQQIATTTDADGRFHLANSTNVLHAEHDGYQPLTLLVNPPDDDLRIQLRPTALSPLGGTILVPLCTPLPPKDRDVQRLGDSGLGLRFTVPRKGWDLRDLGQGDLHEYVLARRHSHAHLTFWFGANAIQLMPEDHFFLESSSFAQRTIVIAGSENASPPRSIGIDSYGSFPEGTRWRHLAAPGSGATYDHAAPRDADLFDGILASLCVSSTP